MRISSVDPVITQPADVPEHPIEPKIWLLLILGISTGFLCGVTTAVARVRQRPLTGLGGVFECTRRPVMGIVKLADPDSVDWQVITRCIDAELQDTVRPVIGVANLDADGSSPNVASELASAFAGAGRRVVLVSLVADGVAGRPGLSAVLAGELVLDDALQATGSESFHRLGGPDAETVEAVFGSARCGALVEQLRTSFDTVIVEDSGSARRLASIGSVASVDGVVLALTDQKTPRKDLGVVVEMLRHNGIPLLGSILKCNRSYDRLPKVGNQMVHQGGMSDENI
jgi:Mrp family chromosome partitioning ATPase